MTQDALAPAPSVDEIVRLLADVPAARLPALLAEVRRLSEAPVPAGTAAP